MPLPKPAHGGKRNTITRTHSAISLGVRSVNYLLSGNAEGTERFRFITYANATGGTNFQRLLRMERSVAASIYSPLRGT